MRRAKIVCTIGPSTRDRKTIARLIAAGVDVFRINFSHGDNRSHEEDIANVRETAGRLGSVVGILEDLPGPKIRVGKVGGGATTLEKGRSFSLTSRNVLGDETKVSVNNQALIRSLVKGSRIFLADGVIELEAREVSKWEAVCTVVNGGVLSSGKGVNVPGTRLRLDYPTKQDISHIEFGLLKKVDFIALSFVRNASDVKAVKRVLRDREQEVPLIAKIEKREAVRNFKHILDVVDAVMVARGDLGVEVPVEQVPSIQKGILAKCNETGKPVIVATQMLLSMMNSPSPTRAEVTDVSTAILDGADALMLSDETAVGRFPVETVGMLDRIARAAEEGSTEFTPERIGAGVVSVGEAVAHAACDLAEYIGAAAIFAPTQTGSTAKRVAKYKPSKPIVAMCTHEEVARNLKLYWGVIPVLTEEVGTTDKLLEEAKESARLLGLARPRTKIVVTSGTLGVKGSTDLVKVVSVN
jgi:pyruvate kinase